jgi:hypothetical protein
MTKTFLKITFAALVTLVAFSCKKNNLVIDQDIVAPAYAKFNVAKTADTLATYYVRDNNAPFKIPVGISAPLDRDVTINFTYTSNDAVAGQQYNAPASITIPAGQTLDTLEVTGLFTGFASSSQIDTLHIKISGGDVPANAYWSGYKLLLRKYCNVDFNTFDGDFDNTIEYSASGAVSWGPYTTTVKNINITSATTATADIENLYDYGGEVSATFDWTNPAAFKVTIPAQFTGVVLNDGGVDYELWIKTNGSSSTFSSCDGSITVFIDAMAYEAATGTYAGNWSTNYRIVMRR